MKNYNEVDIISEGIAIIILTVIGFSLENLLKANETLAKLPKKVIAGVMLYLTGLIAVEKNASCKKMAEVLGIGSHDKLTRVLSEGYCIVSKIGIVFINFCLSKTMGVFLILDDVLVPKRYSKKIEGVYNEFDHVDNEKLKGMRIVVVIWSNGEIRIPVAWAIWHKEDKTFIGLTAKGIAKYQHTGYCLMKLNGRLLPYKTKNEIAKDLFKKVLAKGIKPEYITFDSWYSGKNMLKATRFPVYSRLKENRKVFYEGELISLKEIIAQLPISSFNHKHGAYIRAIQVYLPGYGNIKLLFVKKDKHPEPGKTKFLFSTDLSASASDVLLRYRSRWLIETMFRDIKQNLNFMSCQARSLKNQETHIALAFLSFVILEIQSPLCFGSQKAESIGEKKKLLSSLLVLKQNEKFSILNIREKGTIPILIQNSFFDRVYNFIDFAFQILNYQSFWRSA